MKRESFAIRLSAAANVLLGILGVGFGIYVHVVVPAGFALRGVGDLDRIRVDLKEKLRDLHPPLVTDIVFIGDERWAVASVGE